MSLGVCIDYDGTFTTMPGVWKTIAEMLRANGANVFCITSRFPNVPVNDFPGEVHYACGQPKWEFAHEHDIQVDIWIDDQPQTVGEHPERRGHEAIQARQRRAIVSQIFARLTFNSDGSVALA